MKKIIELGNLCIEKTRLPTANPCDSTPPWFADHSQWEGLCSVGVVESRRTLQGKESVEEHSKHKADSEGLEEKDEICKKQDKI